MTGRLTSRYLTWRSLWIASVVSAVVAAQAQAHQFKLGDVTVDLQEVTTNVDVYYSAMRFNRAASEWDVDVTVSNKSALTISTPLVYLVESFTNTSGPLRPDGVSTNQAYYDLSGQVPVGVLAPGTVSGPRTLGFGFTTNQSPKLVAQLFAGVKTNTSQALAFVRTLDGAGQPLPGVSVQESGPAGTATKLTDSVFGVATLGQNAGEYVWQFSQAGYLSVWRQASLQSNSIAVIPYPWLSAGSQQAFSISPLLGGTASNQTVAVQFAPGSVGQQATVQLTELSSQALPLFLPQGWSPLQAFWLQSSVAPHQPVSASLIPWGPIGSAEEAALVEFSSSPLGWQVLQLVPGNDTNALSVSLPGAGAYALVVADTAPSAPPAPTVGSLLQAGKAPPVDPTNLLAVGTVTPAASPASLVRALVTADGDLMVSNVAGSLPSGTLLKGHLRESYLLADGTTRVPPFYGNSIMAFQRPGQPQLGVVHAHFPMSPLLLFGSEQLDQGVVQAELFPAGPFTGGVFDTNGGVIANAGLRLLAGPGVLTNSEAVQFYRVSSTNFTSLAGTNFLAAFEVGVGTLPPGSELFLQSTGVPPNTTLVLARVLTDQGLYGLEPRRRLESDANGNLLSAEPASGDGLPGLTGSGEYVLLEVQPQQGLVEGIAKNAAGQPAGGLPVQVAGQPWLTFSGADGSFKLLAPAGAGNLKVSDLATGDTGSQAITVPTNLTSLSTSVAVVAGGPRVVSIAPADGSTKVPQVSSVVINFNRAINPATLLSNAVQLLESNLPVAATISLNLANTTVTLLPGAPLDPATQFTLVLATNLTDNIGRPLQGQTQFSFTTVALSARDPAAQLIIYAPGATNLDTNVVAQLPGFVPGTNASLIVVHGTPGCADPGVPVILANEGSGTTTTVLSQPDGSFTSFVSGQEQDYISATFVGLNGARLYVPVTRQLFDDGSVGLYQQGGTLEANGDGGPVQVTVPQNAIASRTKFKLTSVTTNELAAQLGGVIPTNATVAGSALNLNVQGSLPTLPVQVSFPVDLAQLGYPTNEAGTNAAAAVAVVQTNQDATAFQIVDQLLFVPESASSDVALKHGRPVAGHRPRQGQGNPSGGALSGALDTSLGLLIGSLGPVGFVAQIGFNQVLVPLLFGSRPVTIKGQVTSVPVGIADQVQQAGLANQIFNLQLGSLTGHQNVDVPIQLAQAMNIKYVPANVIAPISGTAGNIIGGFLALTLQELKLKESSLATPLSGAFITVSEVGGGLVNEPGRVYPGMVYATSDAKGNFLTVAPAAGYHYVMTCTHPAFQEVLSDPVAPTAALPGQQGQLGLAGAVYNDFFFQLANPDQTAPTVNINNTPVQPAAGQPCQLVVSASQPAATPRIGVVILPFATTNNLLTGQAVTNLQCYLTNSVTTPGPNNSVQYTATLMANAPVEVNLKIVSSGPNGSQGAVFNYRVAFTGPQPATPVTRIPPPPTSDKHGPLVVATSPVNNGFIGQDSAVTVYFNKPIDSWVTTNLQGISLTAQGGGVGTVPAPVVTLSEDQSVLGLAYPGLLPSSTYRLTLSGPSIRDLATQPLDQLPSTPAADSFTMTFRTPPSATAPFSPPLVNGRGCAINGNQLYALDQAPNDNFLLVYDISAPLQPKLLSRTHLFGVPYDLVVIPQYRYVLNVADTNIKTNDLVAVVGGNLGSLIDTNSGDTVTAPGKYLWLLSMADPTAPQLLAQPIVSYRDATVVPKVVWAPPYLVYQESGADIQQLGVVNLQEMIIGFNSSQQQQAKFIPPGQRNAKNSGQDLLSDGTYVDPGDTLPIPDARPAEFYGKHQSYVVTGTTQNILDYSVTPAGLTVGVTLSYGVTLDSAGNPKGPALPPMYRTLVSSGLPLNLSTPTDAMVGFGTTAYPRWVSIFQALPVEVNGSTVTLTLALVSLEPDTNGLQELAVIDISLPEQPKLINKIPVPTSVLGGSMQSLVARPDGLLELAGNQNVVLLNPAFLAITNVPNGQSHPAIVQVVTGPGGNTRSLGTGNGSGVYAAAGGAGGVIVESPPVMQFLSFPSSSTLVDPTALHRMSASSVNQIMAGRLTSPGALAPARFQIQTNLLLPSDLEPIPNPALHYYVLVAAPGGAGSTMELGLESLNPAGFPLSNPGHGFAPVRAESASTQLALGQTPRPNCGAPISALLAYRMSDDTNSTFYNFYLSLPFALITEVASLTDLARLTTEVNRQVLFSGAALRAFIEPEQSTNTVLAPFAAQIDPTRQLVYPIASVSAFTVNRNYLIGNNPPPAAGTTPFEDTYRCIMSHSGELRTPEIDMVLPSPHMQVAVVRTIGNQDNYEGPFGVGWDFNYNQRLTVLDPLTFPAGLQMPLVVRADAATSEVAGSQDVLLNTGEGQVYHFLWMGTNMPAEYAKDPLVDQFDYKDRVSDYYLPQHGVFDLLVKFIDGRFERLTPDGVRYGYASGGRLETIIDRFAQNHHDLQYDSNNHLVRIDDYSVSPPRFVQFGYFRRQATDPDWNAAIDTNTSNPFLEGKICQLVDYAGRNMLYGYTPDGFLTNKLGVMVNGENGGYAGRRHTFYTYKDCQLVGISATVNGTPFISAVNAVNPGGKAVAQSTTGSQGKNQISLDANNSAATVGKQTATVTLGDASSVQRKFDAMGYVASTTVTGTNGVPATQICSNTVDGLEWYVLHPEGNSETRTYDSSNIVFRSRGNVLSRKVDPGPRGGQGYTQQFNYDPRCNLPSGVQTNPDGFQHTVALSPDGTSIASITYANAGTKTFSYNSHGQLIDSVDENGLETSNTFDLASGFPTSTTSGGFGGVTVTFGYDGSIPSQLGRAASMAKPLVLPTTLLYNNLLQPVEIDRGAYVTTTAYDELGRGIIHQEQVGDSQQWTSTLAYNSSGFITNATMSGIEIDGKPGGSASYSYTPDDRLRLQKLVYPDGTVQTYSYDERGNRVTSTLGDYTQRFTYDLNNNETSLTQGGDLVETTAYDGLDRPTNVTYLTGTQAYTVSSSYYPGGEARSLTVTDPVYGVVKYETIDSIDALSRPLSVARQGTTFSTTNQYTYNPLSTITAGPRMTATVTWDSVGNRTVVSNPILKMTFSHDLNGRVTQVDEQEDSATFSSFYKYDNLDHQTSLADLVGTISTYAPRADGNDDTVTDANLNALTVAYSSLGEILQRKRADGMTTVYQHDSQRRVTYEGDPFKGFNFGFDLDMRLTNSTLRSGASMVYGKFDPRNMPTSIALPGGGSETLKYDLQMRLVQRNVSYQSTSWEDDLTFDALGRQRAQTYIQGSGIKNTATYDYDQAGPELAAHYTEDTATFSVTNAYYSDGSRLSTTYPSGVTVTETRDSTGRLTAVSDANGKIISASSWQGNKLPKVVLLGSSMRLLNTYDPRGRLTGSRVTRIADGAVLAHMRYQYDGVNNVQVRQFIHRGGRADVFGYDVGERLALARAGVLLTNLAGAGPFLYQRQYNYDPSGLDFLTTAPLSGPWLNPPAFATNWAGQDVFLLPAAVDGSARSDDPMGNVTYAQLWARPLGASSPQPVLATLQHDGLGHLISVSCTNGVSILNQYQTTGLRFSRQVFQGAELTAYSAYVYDQSARLIEEYDRTGTKPALIARYYYASGDSPAAADLWDQSAGKLQRYYFLRDISQSIIAVADASGNVVERAWYDPFGQPFIELRDTQPPALQSVAAAAGNSLLISFSESVLAPSTDPGAGGGIVLFPSLSSTGIVSLSVNSTNIQGSAAWLPSLPGYPPYSVLQFTPSQPLPGDAPATLSLTPASLADEWGNTNAAQNISFTATGAVGTVYYQAASNTAPVQVARSSVGSSFLFHGQYFDYDTGLIYLRSRFYDPFSGMFFEPDPLGYEESVNHYAGMGNNPAVLRDPSGLGPTIRQSYNRVARRAPGVDEHVTAARDSEEGRRLTELSIGDHNQTGMIGAMRELLPPAGSLPGTVRLVLKYSNSKFVGMLANTGAKQKGENVVQKSKHGRIHFREEGMEQAEWIIADQDGVALFRDDALQDFAQARAFRERSNEISQGVGKAFVEARGEKLKGGFRQTWEKVSDCLLHGFTANLMEEYGTPHYHEGTRGKEWIQKELRAKIKKVPEGFEITLTGTQDNFTLEPIRHVTRKEMAVTLRQGLDMFHEKMDIESPKFDLDMAIRVEAEQQRGAVDLNHHALRGISRASPAPPGL